MSRNKYDPVPENEVQSVADDSRRAADDGRVIFWAPAREYQIGNFRKEVKDGGGIISPESPLRFAEHEIVTDDDEVISFIEKSGAFKAGIIKRCKSRSEANALTAGVKAMKGIKEVLVQDVSSTVIDARG